MAAPPPTAHLRKIRTKSGLSNAGWQRRSLLRKPSRPVRRYTRSASTDASVVSIFIPPRQFAPSAQTPFFRRNAKAGQNRQSFTVPSPFETGKPVYEGARAHALMNAVSCSRHRPSNMSEVTERGEENVLQLGEAI
ncbi:hypothetical protein CSUB01_04153 [Colletotrichum sublineola]|uniref:Uncharacterized protein n=1 Tax=Colletotrichum sublineola TaxID=1173701 RepID=A0A066X1K2_COLSU|nr:hypothetical protein CSUB01_04153 [Colletotrichum sublineola]